MGQAFRWAACLKIIPSIPQGSRHPLSREPGEVGDGPEREIGRTGASGWGEVKVRLPCLLSMDTITSVGGANICFHSLSCVIVRVML